MDLVILLALLFQSTDAGADGWSCSAREEVASGVTAEISRTVAPGGPYPDSLTVAVRDKAFAPSVQEWGWSWDQATTLGAPRYLSVRIAVTGIDRRGVIRLEGAGNIIAAPIPFVSMSHEKGRASVLVTRPYNDRLIDASWALPAWRLSVLDRKGRTLGAAESRLPLRNVIAPAADRLRKEVDRKAEEPEKNCSPLGPDAWI